MTKRGYDENKQLKLALLVTITLWGWTCKAERSGIQEVHLRTIEIPRALVANAGGVKQLLHEVRAVDETLHGRWWKRVSKVPEDLQGRYESFMLLFQTASQRGETIRVLSGARGWVRCASVSGEMSGKIARKRLFCVRDEEGEEGDQELEVAVRIGGNESWTRIGMVRQFDYDEEEQSCAEETEEKEFDYPTSERMLVDAGHGLGIRETL